MVLALLLLLACVESDPEDSASDSGSDGGSDGGAAAVSTSGCALWPLDEGVGDSWAWHAAPGGADYYVQRTETRAGELDGLLQVDEVGTSGGEGADRAWVTRRLYDCEEGALFLVSTWGQWTDTAWGGDPVTEEWSRAWDPPLLVLAADIEVGAGWTFDSTMVQTDPSGALESRAIRGTVEVVARETVTTAAGSFEAWKLLGVPGDSSKSDPLYGTWSWWSAPHGLVATEWQELAEVP